jgi:hypothetical protein
MSRYDAGETSPSAARVALNHAGDIGGHYGQAEKIVLAFLEHMADNYVGDYYIEGSLYHLRDMVRDAQG